MICYGLKKVGRGKVDQWKRGSFFRLADRVYVLSAYNVVILFSVCYTTTSSVFK